jgi:hypothetical protein
MKLRHAKLYNMYVDPKKKYNQEGFKPFSDLHEYINDQLLIGWWTNLATNIQYVIFFMSKQY